jgi:photosystem II stability/assembly factor-like uncharacterized protein
MFKWILVIASVMIGMTLGQAQTFDPSQFESMAPRNIGPAGMSGRITAIDVNLSNQDIIYAGAASGGVWKSINGGIEWTPIFDDQPTQSIGAIEINQANPSEIWVGTGEGNPRNSHNSGAGIFKSVDGGKNWMAKGLEETKLIHRVIVKADESNTIFVGAMGSAWGDSPNRGVYKSTDGGSNWKKVLYVDQRTGVAELIADPNNPNKLFAAMWDFRRTPWDFTSGGKGSGLYVSHDAGENWTKLSEKDGLPKGNLGRMGLAMSAANSNVVYALIEAKENALYKSMDGGVSWKKHSTHENIGNRPFYYYEIHADPSNENIIYSLWSYVSKSTDGGRTFEVIADYGNDVHPDHHALWISPDNPDFVLDGNDGGMNISRDGGETWRFVENLPVGQFYHVNIDNDFPYNVYGGMQDNGSWVGPGFVLKSGGIRNSDWQEVMFGDGFDVSPLPTDNRYGYAMSQGGNLGRYDRLTGRNEFLKPTHPDGETLRYHWNAALAQDPFEDCSLYYGSQFVHYSRDCGLSWDVISPDLTTNDTMKQKQLFSGGLTFDVTGAENHTTIIAISPSPVDKDVIWVGTDDGNVQLTKDGGKTWTNVNTRLPGAPKHAWIPQIEVSSDNAAEAFVVLNNFRQNDWSAYTYHTSNYGATWTRIADDRQIKGFVNAITQDPVESNLLFLGTDVGLYVSLDKGRNWTHWMEGFPAVQIRDMKIQSDMNDLVIGTFGRSFWVMDDIRPLREMAADRSILNKEFAVFDGPVAYLTSRRSYDGIRFSAQGMFAGENKAYGAQFSIWNNLKKEEEASTDKNEKEKDAEEESASKKKDDGKVHMFILNEIGDTISRSSKKFKEKGLVNMTWRLTEEGTFFPSREIREEDDRPSSNVQVMPGQYKAIFKYKGHIDSTMVDVRMDPRVEVTETDVKKKKMAIQNFNQSIAAAADALQEIQKAKASIELVKKMMVNVSDSTQTKIKDLNKAHLKQITELEEIFTSTESSKGIQRDPSKLNNEIGSARRYLRSAWSQPGENANKIVEQTQHKIKDAVERINTYISGDWKTYVNEISAIEFNPFKELKIVEMKE